MLNQSLLRPTRLRNWLPVKTVRPLVVSTATCSTRPPSEPSPLRWVTDRPVITVVPRRAASTPASIDTDQSWFGLAAVASPRSSTAGNVPPAVQPPEEDENSVRLTRPAESARARPAVALTAASLRGSSRDVRVEPASGRVYSPP